ncbi:DNA-binding protein, partial [Salmonella enterica subsp. enterica]|nr:DNA-binding protein [Salmonella enterica subsp. enterica serovar Enteritidis]
KDLMAARLNHHSSIAIQELAHAIGVLDPGDRRTAGVQKIIAELIGSMPAHRVLTADAETLGRAAILAGVISRIQGYGGDRKLRCLHDCGLYLQALKQGLVLVTRNIADFDICLQLAPQGRVLFYRV